MKSNSRRSFLRYAVTVGATGIIVGGLTYLATPKGTVATVTVPGAGTTVTVPTTVTVEAAGEFGRGYKFIYITHGGEENVFWNSVYLGMSEAAKLVGADAVMYRPKKRGRPCPRSSKFRVCHSSVAYTELLSLYRASTSSQKGH